MNSQVVQTAFKIHKYCSVVEEVCLAPKLSVAQGEGCGRLRIRAKGRKLSPSQPNLEIISWTTVHVSVNKAQHK